MREEIRENVFYKRNIKFPLLNEKSSLNDRYSVETHSKPSFYNNLQDGLLSIAVPATKVVTLYS